MRGESSEGRVWWCGGGGGIRSRESGTCYGLDKVKRTKWAESGYGGRGRGMIKRKKINAQMKVENE